MSVDSGKSHESYEFLHGSLLQQIVGPVQSQIGLHESESGSGHDWFDAVSHRASSLLKDAEDHVGTSKEILDIGKVALEAFLQATVTGPPLTWKPDDLILGNDLSHDEKSKIQARLRLQLNVDGEVVYHLLPHVELFALSKCLLNHRRLRETSELIQWRFRVNAWHQRILSDISPSLQDITYRDLSVLEVDESAELLIERASLHILHSFDVKARDDLQAAKRKRGFEYVLTGRLGKRTKFQEKELSQLVVLAKSYDESSSDIANENGVQHLENLVPKTLDLNDDTILEHVAFAAGDSCRATADEALPKSLAELDAGHQPLLDPLDSIILLATASSITNTSPQDALTREETIPYAERVISGGSSNWQVYTQALLVRSRIEGYKTRTVERGVLQLQALVDQVIAETTPASPDEATDGAPPAPATFLPKATTTESAPASERLKYIHQLASPPRWKLEAELADRWVSLGALRTALEIYERLQMWAEVALCWAANDRENKARKIIRHQLYNPVITTSTNKLLEDDDDTDISGYKVERDPLPADAPRLFCILGDLEKSSTAYERAWEVSNHRFARAQRSLGRYHRDAGDLQRADDAYAKSLKVNPQNHATWFALGCVRLQLENWPSAADAFGRAVQIDDADAESWSNLAVSLLKISDSLGQDLPFADRQSRVRDSFVALKRAASLKRESFRIWQNILSVSIKLEPPPYTDIVIAQSKLIDLLGHAEGEKCVDVPIMEAVLADIIRQSQDQDLDATSTNSARPRVGLEKMVIELIQKKITPLITSSRRLWLLAVKLSLFLQHPHAALMAYEKAWRSQLNKPSWDTTLASDSKALWHEVVESTGDLADAYESLGERTREAGMGEGELVAKDWRFKARSAVRSVLARAKEAWEDEAGFERLQQRLHDL